MERENLFTKIIELNEPTKIDHIQKTLIEKARIYGWDAFSLENRNLIDNYKIRNVQGNSLLLIKGPYELKLSYNNEKDICKEGYIWLKLSWVKPNVSKSILDMIKDFLDSKVLLSRSSRKKLQQIELKGDNIVEEYVDGLHNSFDIKRYGYITGCL